METWLQPPTQREALLTADAAEENLTPEEEELIVAELSVISRRLIVEDMAVCGKAKWLAIHPVLGCFSLTLALPSIQ